MGTYPSGICVTNRVGATTNKIINATALAVNMGTCQSGNCVTNHVGATTNK